MVNTISASTAAGIYYTKGYKGGAYYSLMLYLNSTSKDVTAIWGAYAHELILRQFFQKEAGPEKKVKLDLHLEPFPLTKGT